MLQSKDTKESFLSKIKPFVERDGARNVAEIARGLRIPYQTVLFRIKKLYERGITIHGSVDLNKLKLGRIFVSFRLSPDLEKSKEDFFSSLNESSYLTYVARYQVERRFITEFSVPFGHFPQFKRLLRDLEGTGLIYDVQVDELAWRQPLMMRAEYYDNEHGEWDVDWSGLLDVPFHQFPSVSEPESFDKLDLLIIKELQLDVRQPLKSIARKIRAEALEVFRHYHNHVLGKKLIQAFLLRWIGTEQSWSKHGIILVNLSFLNADARKVAPIVLKIPFVTSHSLSVDGKLYMCQLAVPINQLTDTLRYLTDSNLPIENNEHVFHFIDWNFARSYVIPYPCYTEEGWSFDATEAMANITRVLTNPQRGLAKKSETLKIH
jgi:DNA-binding Lrp family transcriptional regulator